MRWIFGLLGFFLGMSIASLFGGSELGAALAGALIGIALGSLFGKRASSPNGDLQAAPPADARGAGLPLPERVALLEEQVARLARELADMRAGTAGLPANAAEREAGPAQAAPAPQPQPQP
ncbi:hypothetical protein C0Z17_26825, partial [Trinickia caryophylli]